MRGHGDALPAQLGRSLQRFAVLVAGADVVALELDRVCSEILPTGRESVPWSQVAAIQVIARLCAPASELHVAERWYGRTALEDLLGVPGLPSEPPDA